MRLSPGRHLLIRPAALVALLLGLTLAPRPAWAQEYSCLDRSGTPVTTVASDSLRFAAWATMLEAGEPVIYWNALRMSSVSPAVRLLVYLHECGHHVLGHVVKLASNDVKQTFEREADCWAIQRITEQEMMAPLLLDLGLQDVTSWTGDRTHLGGPALLESLRRCLSDKTDDHQWDRFLDALVTVSPDSLAWIRGEPISQSADGLVREAIIDAPGTYDCDIRNERILVCGIFAGVRPGPALDRYRLIREIIRSWMGTGWQSIEREQPFFHQPLVFLGWDPATGANLSLVLADTHHIYFTWSAVRPE